MILIRKSVEAEFPAMLAMEMAASVVFWVAEDEGRLSGVMAIQDKGDVALARHAYLVTTTQRLGLLAQRWGDGAEPTQLFRFALAPDPASATSSSTG